MQSRDVQVLADAVKWVAGGRRVQLATIVGTWIGSMRPAGSIVAIREDGLVVGSVTGGCVEAELVARAQGQTTSRPELVSYEISEEDALHHGLSSGGVIRLVSEPVSDPSWIEDLLRRVHNHELVRRTLVLATGDVSIETALPGEPMVFDGARLSMTFGPRWRVLLIGSGPLSRSIAAIAALVGFDVLICDPREGASSCPGGPAVRWIPGQPDLALKQVEPDPHTAIISLMEGSDYVPGLIQALESGAFFVGSIVPGLTSRSRAAAAPTLSPSCRRRLHDLAGLADRAGSPAELALAIVMRMIAAKGDLQLILDDPVGVKFAGVVNISHKVELCKPATS